ncbi:VanZ family protein [Oxalobacteraceae bacterium A2-2]
MWNLILLILAGLCLLLGCLLPNRWLPPSMPNDKLLHFLAFAVLTLLALPLTHGWRQAVLALAGLLLAGWLIECLQQLVPDRRFSWRDQAANAAGVAAAALCWAVFATI